MSNLSKGIEAKIRLSPELNWRIERFAKHHMQTKSGAIRLLLVQALGKMTPEELKAIEQWTAEREAVKNPQPAPVVEEVPEPLADAPEVCPGCGESEMPLVGGPIWLINSAQRKAICNNCAHAVGL